MEPNTIPTQEDGFGEASMAELAELKKALEIGYTDPGTNPEALRVESLDATLKLLTYQAQHIKLWNRIPKTDAASTVEEFNRLSAYGSDGGGFVASGALPEEEDSTYARASELVKYIGTTRSVHHPATLVRTVPADLIGQETQNGALWVMGKANHALYYGDSDAVPLQWNGLMKQIIDGGGHVIDCAGAALTSGNLEDAAQLVADNFGMVTSMFSGTKVFHDFSDTYNLYQRFAAPGGTPGVIGTPVTGFRTLSGLINFEPDVFCKAGSTPPTAATSTKAPNAPTLAEGTPASNTLSKFVAADAGAYKYQVTAVNQYGESAPCAISTGAAIGTGEDQDLTITDGGGTYEATAYKIYRTEKDGATCYYTNYTLPRDAVAGVYQATTAWTDVNEWRPRTMVGLVLDLSIQSLTFRQLLPMIKMNLAIIAPALRWMQLLYGTPIVFAPKKNVVVKNILAV